MRIATIYLMFALVPTLLHAQDVMIRSDNGPAPVIMTPGGILMLEDGDGVQVRRHMKMSEGDDAVDIKEGDLIIYLNGTRIESVPQLVGLYEELAVGAEVKLGIQRGDAKMIRSFERPEAREGMDIQMDGGGMRVEIAGGPGGIVDQLDDPQFWGIGFVVGMRDGEVTIGQSIPTPRKPAALRGLKEGDIVLAINGTQVSDIAGLLEAYDAVDVGDEMTAQFRQGEEELSFTFPKPEAPPMQMRIERN